MKKNQEEISFWQSTTDLLSALLLVIMLVSVLLILYLMQAPEEQWTGYGDASPTPIATPTPEFGDGDFDEGDDGDGAWYSPTPEGWATVTPTATITPTPTPTPYNPDGGGIGGGGDPYGDWGKAAVYAMIVDTETNRVIPKENIVFELFDTADVRQTLHTYYPERVWYYEFTTTENGTFYLPEKVQLKGYYLRAQNAPEGYDNAENVYFTLDESYDWPAPYVVRIPFTPSKNVINVQLTDADTELGVGYGTFRVIAAEDIVTPDGTLRYAKGEVADIITCDAEGKGQSIELYLGEYIVEQEEIPRYYAGMNISDQVTVRKKDTFDTAVYLNYRSRKSAVVLTARDELYPKQVLEGVEFAVFRDGGELNVQNLTTDKLGQIIFTDLEKDTVYHVRQLSSQENYRFPEDEFTFTVSETGLIEDKPIQTIDVHNSIIRVAISAVDAIMRSSYSDISMGMYDENGAAVKLWATSGMPETLTGLAPGKYSLVVDGNTQQRKFITVQDTFELQSFSYDIWSSNDTLILVGAVAGLCILAVILVKLRKRK